jgi:NAD(P) transhydrogenase
MAEHYDLVVIGSGPAGEKGGAQAAYFGKRVAVVERGDLGGAGINTGTLPSKTLRETALYFSGLRQRGLYGIDYSLKENLTVQHFMYRKQEVVQNHWFLIHRNLKRHNIDLIFGEASLRDKHTVQVMTPEDNGIDLTADVILIATGSSPHHPEGIPFDGEVICDSDSILHIDRIPKSLAVVGGGIIGCEYACVFAALGVQVTLIDGRDRLLSFIDAEISERLRQHLETIGVRLMLNTEVESVQVHDEQHAHLTLSTGEFLTCDIALYAAGRKSNVEGLNLDRVGVEVGERGLIQVNEKYQTAVPNIYAAGDVIGHPALASTSMEQARVAMVHAFDLHYKERISPVIPYAVYTIPEIAYTGLSEEDCVKEGIPYLVGRSWYEKSPRGQIIGDTGGMLKLVFSPEDKKLLGVHLIGEMASELIHLGAQVIATGGTIDTFIQAVYNYPSLTDSYKYAAYDGLGNRDHWLQQQITTETT